MKRLVRKVSGLDRKTEQLFIAVIKTCADLDPTAYESVLHANGFAFREGGILTVYANERQATAASSRGRLAVYLRATGRTDEANSLAAPRSAKPTRREADRAADRAAKDQVVEPPAQAPVVENRFTRAAAKRVKDAEAKLMDNEIERVADLKNRVGAVLAERDMLIFGKPYEQVSFYDMPEDWSSGDFDRYVEMHRQIDDALRTTVYTEALRAAASRLRVPDVFSDVEIRSKPGMREGIEENPGPAGKRTRLTPLEWRAVVTAYIAMRDSAKAKVMPVQKPGMAEGIEENPGPPKTRKPNAHAAMRASERHGIVEADARYAALRQVMIDAISSCPREGLDTSIEMARSAGVPASIIMRAVIDRDDASTVSTRGPLGRVALTNTTAPRAAQAAGSPVAAIAQAQAASGLPGATPAPEAAPAVEGNKDPVPAMPDAPTIPAPVSAALVAVGIVDPVRPDASADKHRRNAFYMTARKVPVPVDYSKHSDRELKSAMAREAEELVVPIIPKEIPGDKDPIGKVPANLKAPKCVTASWKYAVTSTGTFTSGKHFIGRIPMTGLDIAYLNISRYFIVALTGVHLGYLPWVFGIGGLGFEHYINRRRSQMPKPPQPVEPFISLRKALRFASHTVAMSMDLYNGTPLVVSAAKQYILGRLHRLEQRLQLAEHPACSCCAIHGGRDSSCRFHDAKLTHEGLQRVYEAMELVEVTSTPTDQVVPVDSRAPAYRHFNLVSGATFSMLTVNRTTRHADGTIVGPRLTTEVSGLFNEHLANAAYRMSPMSSVSEALKESSARLEQERPGHNAYEQSLEYRHNGLRYTAYFLARAVGDDEARKLIDLPPDFRKPPSA